MSNEAVKWAMDDAPMLLTDKGKPDTTARHVLQVLAEHASPDGSNSHPSVLRIQYRTGYDERTVQRALRRLEAGTLIKRHGSVQGRTRWRLSMKLRRPEFDWAELEAEAEAKRDAAAERQRKSRAKRVTHSPSVTVTHSDDVTETPVTHSDDVSHALRVRDVTHSASECHALNAPLTTNQPPVQPPVTNTRSPLDAASTHNTDGSRFDAFWNVYPRKVGKGHARKAYTAAIKRGADPAQVLAAAERHRTHHTRCQTEPRFIPHPATWLNQERYDDAPEPPNQPTTRTPSGYQPFQPPPASAYENGRF